MRSASFILCSLSLLIILSFHASCDKGGGKNNSAGAASSNAGGMSIAYVDIDSFENNYDYLKAKREELNKRQLAMQGELQRSAQQLQSSAAAFQQKVESRNISQVEAEATQRKLAQMQQSLQLREQALTEQLLKEKDEFNKQLHDDLDSFLVQYNKDKKYDYIFSHSRLGGSPILLANPQYDITTAVIEGMNKMRKVSGDTAKKKN